MFTRIRLENFKSWRELDIALAPITVLFGTNSSGKSSVLQSILFFLQNLDMSQSSINFGGEKDLVNLGSYREVIYQHDESLNFRTFLLYEPHWLSSFPTHLVRQYKNRNGTYTFDIAFQKQDDRVLINWEHETEYLISVISVNDISFNYLGPVRQNPQRSYLWSGAAPRRIEKDGENTIVALVESTRRDGALLKQVAEWLVKMELVDGFNVAALDEGNRFYETLVKVGGVESALLDTGFGVSQVLPVVTMLFFAPEGSIILLEQPELHLHPRAQAHLADLMLHVAEERKLQLIVESHSEHLLRRLQRRIAEVEHDFAQPDNVRMYFCDKGENGSTIQSVEVDEYGQINNWPDNFFGDITGDLEAMTRAALQRAMHGGK